MNLIVVESPTPHRTYLAPEASSLALTRGVYAGQAKAHLS